MSKSKEDFLQLFKIANSKDHFAFYSMDQIQKCGLDTRIATGEESWTTLLHLLVKEGSPKVVSSCFYQKNSNINDHINITDSDNMTILDRIIESGDTKYLSDTLARKPAIKKENVDGILSLLKIKTLNFEDEYGVISQITKLNNGEFKGKVALFLFETKMPQLSNKIFNSNPLESDNVRAIKKDLVLKSVIYNNNHFKSKISRDPFDELFDNRGAENSLQEGQELSFIAKAR